MHNKKITFDEAKKRFEKQGRIDIQLCEDGYEGWSKKSKFYDLIEKDYFFAVPNDVCIKKSCHPKRARKNVCNKQKITFDEAKKRFEKQGRADIKICEDGYSGWKNKSKFYDLVQNDYFFAVPAGVFRTFSSHPKRAFEKIKQTNIKRYGVECSLNSPEIRKKISNTIKKKYGCEHVLSSPIIKDKIKQTNIERYGVDNPFKNLKIIKNQKETMIRKFGVENYTKTTEYKKKYSKYFSCELNNSARNWLCEHTEPKPSYIVMSRFFKANGNNNPTIDELEKFVKNYKDNKTALEVLSEQLFDSPHFNKKPEQIKKNYRPDFKLSDTVFVNVDGLYWHSEREKSKNYHFEMRKEFEENNLRIFQFYNDEINKKQNVVKSIIENCLGKTKNKIYARNCIVYKVDQKEANNFLNNNHLMGSTMAKHIGLYFESKLICILSYKEIKNYCKIERFCSLTNCSVLGGFSKLLKHLEFNLLKPTTTEIHNWVDLRYGTGKHLETKGFKLIKETLGWKWTDGLNTYNRLKCRANMDERKLTEKEHAEELKLFKIYDAGQRLYVKKIKIYPF